MEYQDIILKYNPKAKLAYGIFNQLKQDLLRYKDFINLENKEKEEKKEPQKEITGLSIDIIRMGDEMKTKGQEAVNNLNIELLKTFYSITDSIINELDMIDFDNLLEKIKQDRGDLLAFFLGSKN